MGLLGVGGVVTDAAPLSDVVFHQVCHAEDLWEGDMDVVPVGGQAVLLVNVAGAFKAYANVCPHQGAPLGEGRLDGCILTCRAHQWTFNVATGLGVNPRRSRLVEFPVRVVEGMVHVGDRPIG